MQEITGEWVDKAESDFAAAHRLMRRREDEPPLVDAVCFHSQQCVEKYLKAFLQEHNVRFEYKHPLEPLLGQCLSLDASFEELRRDVVGLEGYAVAVRYPGAKVTDEMAERALAAAVRIRAFIHAKLGLDQPPTSKGA